jgi:uncharacterized membrane protein
LGDLLRGYAVVSLCGWAAFPFLHRALASLPDRGYAASRAFGFVLAAWIGFAGATLAGRPLSTGGARAAIVAVLVLSVAGRALIGALARRSGAGGDEPLMAFARRRAGTVALVETLFVVATLVLGWLLDFNPAIDPDSERFMDYALLRSTLRGSGLPAADPWFGGAPLNYYHFGYAVIAFLVRAAGRSPERLFVPALALVHALAWCSAFGAGLALYGRRRPALGAAVAVLAAGNFEWMRQWVTRGTLAGFDWFSPSRVIRGAICEFPFFSMLWGDLHPYVVALPLFLVALNVVLGGPGRPAIRPRATGPPVENGPPVTANEPAAAAIGRAAALAFIAGACFAVHVWDAPVLFLAATLVWLSSGATPRGMAIALAPFALAPLPFLFALRGFRQSGRGLGWVAARSDPLEWAMAFGPFVLLGALLLLATPRLGGAGRAVMAAAGRDATRRWRTAGALACAGLLVALACEVIYVPDMFASTEMVRMNTVFKWHRLAWVLLGLAAPAGLQILRAATTRAIATAGAVLLVAGSGIDPALGTSAWIRARAAAAAAEGAPAARAALRPGAAADALFRALDPGAAVVADYLSRQARPGDVVLEETGEAYTWSARVATFSGVPAVLGWGNHEAGWRQDWPGVLRRQRDVAAIYLDPASHGEALRHYGVTWAVVGGRERASYGESGLGQFDRIGAAVLESGDTRLYRFGP